MPSVSDSDRPAQIIVGPISQSQISEFAYASLDLNPIHIDKSYAMSQGLPNTVVHGILLVELVTQAVMMWFQHARITSLTSLFLHPVFESESVSISFRQVHPTHDQIGALLRVTISTERARAAVVSEVRIAIGD